MNEKKFISKYLDLYKKNLFERDVSKEIIKLKKLLLKTKKSNNKIIIEGNGASAAIASHVAVDFTKLNNIRTINFNEADLITCFANDYGYENWLAKALEYYSVKDDLVILVSSSGRSPNIIKAAQRTKELKLKLVTLTGFDKNNPLKKLGDLNLWVDSRAYNIIENTHLIWLLAVNDLIFGNAEYTA